MMQQKSLKDFVIHCFEQWGGNDSCITRINELFEDFAKSIRIENKNDFKSSVNTLFCEVIDKKDMLQVDVSWYYLFFVRSLIKRWLIDNGTHSIT